MTLRVGIEILSAIPGKSGTVGNLWRNNMRLLPEAGHDMEFIFFITPQLMTYYNLYFKSRPKNLTFIEIPVEPDNIFRKILAQEITVPRLMNKYKVDVFFTANPVPLFFSVRQFKIYKITGLQFLYVPEQVGRKQTLYHRTATPRKARLSDIIIANSTYTKNEIIKFLNVNKNKVEVIYEAVDHELFNIKSPIDKHWKVLSDKFSINYEFVLYISDLRPYKNPMLLIRTYEELLRNCTIKEHLVIIGNSILGYGEELMQYASQSPFSDRIHFLPFQEPFDLTHFYRCASLFVYPSELETFGTPPLEAMACGTPVIVSNKTAMPEVAGDGALHFDPKNSHELVEVMGSLLTDNYLRETMINRGFKRCNLFSWEKHAQETISLIRRVA